MLTKIDDCVNCEQGCIGRTCRYHAKYIRVCDICGRPALYKDEDGDYCEACAYDRANEVFEALDWKEREKLLDLPGYTPDEVEAEWYDMPVQEKFKTMNLEEVTDEAV